MRTAGSACTCRATMPSASNSFNRSESNRSDRPGIVERLVQPDTPVRIEYHLSPKGEALAAVVQSASAWAEEWLAPERQPAQVPIESSA